VRDIISGACHQRYAKCLEQQKGRPNVWFLRCRRKFRRGTTIKSVFDCRFTSNKHSHMVLFVTQGFWVFIVQIWAFLACNPGLFEITEWDPCQW